MRVVSEMYKKALKVQILNEVSLIQVVRKRVRFQDRMNEQINVLLKNDHDHDDDDDHGDGNGNDGHTS